MIDTTRPLPGTGNIPAAEALKCNFASGSFNTPGAPTQSTRPPPAIKIPFDNIEISAISVHLTSNTPPGWGTATFPRVELSAFLFCDISLNGFPWDASGNDFVKHIDLGIYTGSESCYCLPVNPPFNVGCRVPDSFGQNTRGAIAVAFKLAGSPSTLTNQPSISVALHYKILP